MGRQMAMIKGKWRIYNDPNPQLPKVFCVDDGNAECRQTFVEVYLRGAAQMRHEMGGNPECWVEIEGDLDFDRGRCTIWGEAYARQRQW